MNSVFNHKYTTLNGIYPLHEMLKMIVTREKKKDRPVNFRIQLKKLKKKPMQMVEKERLLVTWKDCNR